MLPILSTRLRASDQRVSREEAGWTSYSSMHLRPPGGRINQQGSTGETSLQVRGSRTVASLPSSRRLRELSALNMRRAAVRALEFTALTNVPRAVLVNSVVPKAMIQ
jgi:hypothetical protein